MADEKMKAPYLISIFLLISFYATAQKGFQIPDSISNKDYEALMTDIDNYENDSIKLWLYLKTYTQKAKNENNKRELITAYRKTLKEFEEETALKYSDSIMNIATSLNDHEIIGGAYIDRAVIYFVSKDYHKSLQNYLTADKYINKNNDIYTHYKIKYGIANIKLYLGHYKEAATLFEECAEYYKNGEGYNSLYGYLYSLRSLGKCLLKLGDYDRSSQINKLGIEKSNGKYLETIHSYFLHSEGINQFAKGNYNESIDYLQKSLPEIIQNEDFANIALTYMYLGKDYLKLNNDEKGIAYLQKVDSILQEHDYANLELRETYEIFINYYKEKGDLENQLLYTNRLLEADKILEKNYKDLISTIHKEYDTAALIASKDNLEKTLKRNTVISYTVYCLGGLVILVISLLLIRNYKKQKVYKLKYEELIAKTEKKETKPEEVVEVTEEVTDDLDINQDIIVKILGGLEAFENREGFLNAGINQSALAEDLNTNTSYLSKVINHYKGKNFNSYLNELRVNHAVTLLKNSSVHRRYTIKALAEELGFSNPRSFSDAFFSQTGIKPSYFIKQLEKEPAPLLSA